MTRIENKLADLLDSLSLNGYSIITSMKCNKIKESFTLKEDDEFVVNLTEKIIKFNNEIEKISNEFRTQNEKEMRYNFCLTIISTAIKDYVDIIYLGNKDIKLGNVSKSISDEFIETSNSLKRLITVLQRIYERKTNESIIIDYEKNKVTMLRN